MKEQTKLHTYTRAEERANVLTHLIGVIFIGVAGPGLLLANQDLPLNWAIGVYIATFVLVFASSSLYHFVSDTALKRQLRKVDHISIYFFIAGSNTPFLVQYKGSALGMYFLVFMWVLVLAGTLYKLLAIGKFPWISLLFYLLLGWLGVVTMYLIFPTLSEYSFWLIVLGGVLYTGGTFFYHRDSRRWFHSIWHIFVLLAALAHYGAIYISVT